MNITRRQFIAGLFFSGAGVVSTDSLYFERYFIETNEFDIGTPSISHSTIRMLQISDIHLKKLTDHHKKLADQVNELNPELLLFTGDIIESERGLRHLDNLLQLFDSDVQKAAVMGNWECEFEIHPDKLQHVYESNNGELLINRTKVFMINGKRLLVTGVDTLYKGRPDFAAAIKGVGPEDHHIVLSHCPEYRDHIESEITKINAARPAGQRLNIAYVFSGHSHGGQVNIMGFTPLLPPGVGRYVRGWFRDRSPMLYVSKGIGTSIFPVRFGARAEIALFNYHIPTHWNGNFSEHSGVVHEPL
jgi:predicted MPP superfamily phosphohydrolase